MGNILGMLFAYTLPATMLSYGVVWWTMRPKQPPSFSIRDHAIFFCVSWAAAVLANIGFAPDARSAVMGHSSPALLLVPGIAAAMLIAWAKNRLSTTATKNRDSGEKAPTPTHVSANNIETSAESLYALVIKYIEDEHQDLAMASSLLQKAAQQNHAQSLYLLGIMCQGGEGMPQDIKAAESYMRQASQHGHAEAKAWLANVAWRRQ